MCYIDAHYSTCKFVHYITFCCGQYSCCVNGWKLQRPTHVLCCYEHLDLGPQGVINEIDVSKHMWGIYNVNDTEWQHTLQHFPYISLLFTKKNYGYKSVQNMMFCDFGYA